MRELKLKYFLDLVSNVGAKSQAEAKLMQQAQEAMNAAIVGTNNKFLDYNKLAVLAGKNTGLMQEVITGATNKFVALERALDHVGRNTSLERQVGYAQRLAGAYDAAKVKATALRQIVARGIGNAPERFAELAGGYYGARAVVAKPVSAFSNLESATEDLRIAMTDATGKVSGEFEKIRAEAVQLGNQLPGTTKDFMRAARALATQGVPNSVVANGGLRASSYVGVLLDMQQEQAAETIAKLREAHGLKDNELVPMADLVQRGFFGFGIRPQDYLETAKYTASTYNTMGITGLAQARETLAIQGMAANVGLEGSSFGTNYAMMLRRLGEVENRKSKNTKEAQEVRAMLGEHGISMQFFNDQGVFGGNVNMLQQLAKLRALSPLDQQKVLTRLFGVEASRPAQILVQKGMEGYNAALGTINSQGSLDQRIAIKMDTFAAKLEALGGTVENLGAAMARQIGLLSKPAMDGLNNLIGGPVQGFFERNPTAGTATLGAGAALSAWLTARFGSAAVKALLARVGGGAAAAGAEGAAGGAAAAAGGAGALTIGGVAAAGAYDLWQIYRLVGGLRTINQMKNREGVVLSPYARRRLAGQPEPGPVDLSGMGMPGGDFLTLTTPGGGLQSLAPGRQADIKVGEGRLDVLVRVADDRVTATTSVAQPLSLVKINPGNTNPAGYGPGPGGTR